MTTQLLDQLTSSFAELYAGTYLQDTRPDVIISTTPGLPMLFTGDALARILRVPHVAEVRDAWPDLIWESTLIQQATRGIVPRSIVQACERRLLPALFYRCLQRAVATIVTTSSFQQRYKQRGIEDVHVLRNMANVGLNQHSNSVRARSQAGEDPFNLLYVGTVGRSQGLQYVIQAVKQVPGVELRIVGDGAEKSQLCEAASGNDRITFFPQTVGKELDNHWKWANSGLVSLSKSKSNQVTVPSKLYDIMARGKHVTGVVAGEAAEIINVAHAGHTAEPGDSDSIAELLVRLSAGELPAESSEQSVKWVNENASPAIVGQKLETLLCGVVS